MWMGTPLLLFDELYLSSPPASLSDVAADVESDHDYEIVDETLSAMMKSAQENVRFY